MKMSKHIKCSKCKELKPLTEYHRNGVDKMTGEQQYRTSCKACEANREKTKSRPKATPVMAASETTTKRLQREFHKWEVSQNPWHSLATIKEGEDSCWSYNGAIDKNGYAVFVRKGYSSVNAHRAIMEYLGFDLKGLHVHHECHNRGCINPAHLTILTPEAHAAIHANDLSEGSNIGPQLPTYWHRKYVACRAAVSDTLCGLSEMPTLSYLMETTGYSEYLIRKVLKEV